MLLPDPVLRKSTKIELLRGVPLFSACSKKQLGEIAEIARQVDLPRGTVLIREGEPGSQFYVILDGTVEVEQNGRKLPKRGDDSFFGEISLLMRYPTTATVTATSSVHALAIAPAGFRRLLNEYPGIQSRVLLALAQRLAPQTL
jgi:CRP-like cAMP-binding protein